jgi:hypothetical protein
VGRRRIKLHFAIHLESGELNPWRKFRKLASAGKLSYGNSRTTYFLGFQSPGFLWFSELIYFYLQKNKKLSPGSNFYILLLLLVLEKVIE